MKRSKWIPILLAICLLAPSAVMADSQSDTQTASKKVSVHFKPDITIKMGEQTKSFYDASGSSVFPIIYEGTTYLPVRAISGLMGEHVEWDNLSKTVFIGKSLKNPTKAGVPDTSAVKDGSAPYENRPLVQVVEAYLQPDVIVMYDFVVQRFSDENGEDVYPLNYKGSVYLPVRAISRLMGEEIQWDAGLRLIIISDSKAEQAAREQEEEEATEERTRSLRSALKETVDIYEEVTAKIAGLQEAESQEELEALAGYVSDDYRRLNNIKNKIKRMSRAEFTDEQMDAHDKLIEFSEACEGYILVLENIIYMASTGQDFSIIAETFLNFALDAEEKRKSAEDAVQGL